MKESRDVTEDDSKISQLGTVADFGASFVISGVLAIVFKTMFAPLERIKLILQTQTSSHQIGKASRIPYSGLVDAIVRIPREQGFTSLWRGNVLNICRYFPAQGINFSFYGVYYNAFQQIIQPKTVHGYNLLSFLSGGAVGFTTCLLLFPFNFCHTRISVDLGDGSKVKREFYNLNDCLNKIYRTDGFRGFYQGMSLMAVGMFIYRSAYFGIYTTTKRLYLNLDAPDAITRKVQTPLLVSMALAQLSAFTGTVIAYPLDTIARQKMLWSGRGAKNYLTTRQVISRIIQRDGLIGFYRGMFANQLTTLCGSCVLVSYDFIKGYYEVLVEPKKVVSDIRRSLRKIDD